jgi:hypothetical protein
VGVSQVLCISNTWKESECRQDTSEFQREGCTWDHQSVFAVLFIVSLMIVPWGDRVREEAQRETDSLRVYVGSVEAAAAGLLSRVQELEHLLALCMHPTLMFL